MHFYVREWPNLTGNIKSMIGLCVFIVKLVVFMVFMVSAWLSHVVYGSRRLSFFFDLAVTWSDTFNASSLLKRKCELQENFSNFNKWKKRIPHRKGANREIKTLEASKRESRRFREYGVYSRRRLPAQESSTESSRAHLSTTHQASEQNRRTSNALFMASRARSIDDWVRAALSFCVKSFTRQWRSGRCSRPRVTLCTGRVTSRVGNDMYVKNVEKRLDIK